MKSIVINSPYNLNVSETDMPTIKNSNEVLVKTKKVGICGSDLHIYHGSNPLATYPRIIGHEVAGEIVGIGSDVIGFKVGDHVVVEPINYCGECYACKKGRPNVCDNLSVFGVHEDGGLREYFVLPSNQIHKVDKGIPWDEIVLAEPYTIGAQAVWRGNVQQGDYVFIHGCGPIGISILKMVKLHGAIAIMSDINDERLLFAQQSGADYTISPLKDNVNERVKEWTNNMGANVVIDAVCLPQTVEQSIELASSAGTVVILGFADTPSQIAQLPITKKELTIVGSRLQTNKFEEVIRLLNEGKLKESGLISHQFKFSEVSKAIKYIENNPNLVRKVIITFD